MNPDNNPQYIMCDGVFLYLNSNLDATRRFNGLNTSYLKLMLPKPLEGE